MTLEQEVNTLATSVENLTDTVKSKTGTLDAAVFDAQSATSQAQTAKTGALTAQDEASAHKDAAYTAAQSAASAVAYQDLTALAESKAVNAVDVFIYDTSKDSDGGAWRHRCTGTSWYNEPLNTPTRGSRREFPAVAVIVTESTSKVTIYDGDDPALPMWMVFRAGAGFYAGAGPASCVFMAQGQLAIGHSTGGFALSEISFLADRGVYRWVGGFVYLASNIALRNTSVGYSVAAGTSSSGIVSDAVNDVAMTVLPDAPIDPATGLPVPTIAVATEGGVSVIKDDGTVVDSANTNRVSFIDFYGQRMVAQSVPYGWFRDFGDVSAITADGFGGVTYNDQQYPRFKATFNQWDIVGFDVAQSIGLTKFAPDLADKPKGMSALLTSTYNTGWMPGDIKLAALSDTDDSELVGGELVTNGGFDTDSDWAANAPATISISGGTITLSGGNNPDSHFRGLPFAVTEGQCFKISADIVSKNTANTSYIRLWKANSNAANAVGIIVGGTTTGSFESYVIIPTDWTEAQVVVQIGGNPIPDTTTLEIDNISVKLADSDRSVNNNGLIVNGTITREPVAPGADLVAYSGFSADNYLEQPYNPDLEFGTGDFSVMGWVKHGTSFGAICCFGDGAPTGHVSFKATNTGFGVYGSRVFYVAISTPTTSFSHFCYARKDGVIRLYIDGVDRGSAAFTVAVGLAGQTLMVGNELNSVASDFFRGSLALLRISATVPTPEQIRKIYNDEKHLFQENAKCTLYGTSDAVTALAHDPDTDLLHVGTNQGRSVFKGLRRVDNTTTPVTTAIAANNGMVIEQ